MTADEPLFGGYEPPAAVADPSLSPDRRRTARQAELIRRGVHPLTRLPAHELAPTDASPQDGKNLPYRCGSCVYRQVAPWHNGSYPKCWLPGPGGEAAKGYPRVSHSAASDVRAWWPACGDYRPQMERGAVLSECGTYRYELTRRWSRDESAVATFIMLNPSIADAELDDPTIRRCIGFAQAWGMGGLHVCNLYALRSTDPKGLWTHPDPVGPDNDVHLARHALAARAADWPLVAAWGANAHPDRVEAVLGLPGMTQLTALGVTKAGAPKHPLARGHHRIPDNVTPAPWSLDG